MAAERGALERILDVWGYGTGFTGPHRDTELITRDGVRLAASTLGDVDPPAHRPAVVLAHGFGGHRRKAAFVRLAEALSEVACVLTVDLRGHGDSGGRSTLGDLETLDVRAAAGWLRSRGHRWVAGVGLSMGGTAILRCAGSRGGGPFDAVCAVSAPADFTSNGTPPLRALSTMVTSTTWRTLVERGLRVRVARGWGDPTPALTLASRIQRPVLLVHGRDDHYFDLSHAERLAAAAGGVATLWTEPDGFGHAEDGLDAAFSLRLAQALAQCAAEGRWCARTAVPALP